MSWLEHIIVLAKAKPISRVVAALIVSSSFYLAAEPLHDQITEAIIGLASEDVAVKQRAIDFLQSAPPEFRENMESQYRSEAQALAQSLPQQIDALTTIQSVFVTNSEMQITYTLHFNSGEYPDSDLQAIKSNLTDQTRTEVCHIPGSVLLSLLYGKDFVRNYFYSDGNLLHSVRVSWKDCK